MGIDYNRTGKKPYARPGEYAPLDLALLSGNCYFIHGLLNFQPTKVSPESNGFDTEDMRMFTQRAEGIMFELFTDWTKTDTFAESKEKKFVDRTDWEFNHTNGWFRKQQFPILDENTDFPRFSWDNKNSLVNGYFGFVFTGKDKTTGKDVAIKEFNASNDGWSDAENETTIFSKLCHKNIAKMVGAFQLDRKPYIVMELCTGGSMLDLISGLLYSDDDIKDIVKLSKKQKDCRYLTDASAKKVAKEILSALVYCHDMQIIHSDLKLPKIMLSEKVKKGKPLPPIKLIDWELSCTKNNAKECEGGTPGYAAPEAYDGSEDSRGERNEKFDVWSTGVIVFQLLTGNSPFRVPNNFRVPKKHAVKKYAEFPKNTAYGEFTDITYDRIDLMVSTSLSYYDFTKEHLNFLHSLLEADPSERVSALDALQDPWLKDVRT